MDGDGNEALMVRLRASYMHDMEGKPQVYATVLK